MARDAGVGTPILVEELGELFQHHAAQLLGVDDRHGAAVVAGHVVTDADRDQLDLAQALDVLEHIDLQVREVRWGVLQPDVARKGELVGACIKPGNRNKVAENVV